MTAALPAGTYRVSFAATMGNTDKAGMIRLYNVTDAAELQIPLGIRQKTADAENSVSQFALVVFAGVSKTFQEIGRAHV